MRRSKSLCIAMPLIASMASLPLYAELPTGYQPPSIEDFGAVAYADAKSGITFVKVYSAFNFQSMKTYGSPKLGYSLSYAVPNGTGVTVYVYDYGVSPIPDGARSAQVEEQMSLAVQGMRDSGLYASVVDRDCVVLSERFLQKCHRITTKAEGWELASYLLIQAKNRHFVKVRITGEDASVQMRAPDFLKELQKDIDAAQAPVREGEELLSRFP